MKGFLVDVNVLLALAWPNHVHHGVARGWFAGHAARGWATCSVTQLGFVRLSSHPSFTAHHRTPDEARRLLRELTAQGAHAFWNDPPGGVLDATLDEVFADVLGHALVTDAFLVAMARHHRGRVATLDSPLAELFPAHVTRID